MWGNRNAGCSYAKKALLFCKYLFFKNLNLIKSFGKSIKLFWRMKICKKKDPLRLKIGFVNANKNLGIDM